MYDGKTAIQILCAKILDESRTFITSENIDNEFYTKFQIEFDFIPLELIKVWRIIRNVQMCTDEEIKSKLNKNTVNYVVIDSNVINCSSNDYMELPNIRNQIIKQVIEEITNT